MSTDLARLIFGDLSAKSDSTTELGEIFAHIQGMVGSIVEHLSWLGHQADARVSILGPFLGRSLLELGVTALLGRLDPLRLRFVRRVQSQPGYKTEIPWKASIRWQGDVIPNDKDPKNDANRSRWDEGVEYEKMARALLGSYYDELLWQPGFERMLGSSPAGGVWLAEISAIDAKAFVPRKKQAIARLYSSLSKGIHHEFVMPPNVRYDRGTIADYVQQCIHIVADLALISHFVPHAAFTLGPADAFAAFNNVENVEVFK